MGDRAKRPIVASGQSTLFQTWGSLPGVVTETGSSTGNGQDDVTDEVLAAMMALQEDEQFGNGMSMTTGAQQGKAALNETHRDEVLSGFDEKEGAVWIYPTNYPKRDYQYNITSKALFNNTLVSLPTGLGKTFIAAVVMFNFYRWYPRGKVVFMAPTKPLVAQQIEACFKVMGIQQSDMCEMTGQMQPVRRENEWLSKRVFFLTPQVLQNDLGRGSCPAVDIVCVVVDEAHRALGNHSYTQVVKELANYTRKFRVLALSATPGDNVKAVQEVVTNLMISDVELRSEDSIDIQPYTHKRKEEKFVVKLGEELTCLKDKFLQIVAVNIKRLVSNRALYSNSLESFSKFMLLKARDDFHKRMGQQANSSRGVIEGDFAMSITLYHAYELLLQHGMRSFYHFLKAATDGTKGQSRNRMELTGNPIFNEIMAELKEKFDPDGTSHISPSKFMTSTQRRGQSRSRLLSSYGASKSTVESMRSAICSHPKLKKLVEIVLEHFHRMGSEEVGGGMGSRVMIFSQYRESVHEIADVLSVHRPTIRVMTFVGQASAGKSSRGLTQKEQLQIVQRFREGGYNTLVATCVGEEGLDIGEVDLIVCFDAHASPVRLVQRLGRTGRKRDGRIVVLVTEGKEEKTFKKSESSKKIIHKAIRDACRSFRFYPDNPRMVPRHVKPQALEMHMTVDDYIDPHTRKRGRSNISRNGTLKQCFSNWGKKGDAGFLTDGELCYWSDHFMLPQEELDRIGRLAEGMFPSTRPFLCLSKAQKSVETDCSRQTCTSLVSSYMTLSPFHCIGHSLRCHQLVELAQFADMCMDRDDDDDTYGLEMMTYLNDDDVVSVTRQPQLNSVADRDHPKDNSLEVGESENSKVVVKQKRKKAAQMFPEDDDDFVECLRARRLSDSSDSEDPLPVAFQSRHVAKDMAMPVGQRVSKRQANDVRTDLSFDSLLPQPSQFVAPRISPSSSKSRSIISEAPPNDETFGGLLSQLPRSEETNKKVNLTRDEEQRQDIGMLSGPLMVRNDDDMPTARPATSCSPSSDAVIDVNKFLLDKQEDENFMDSPVSTNDVTAVSTIRLPVERTMVHASEDPLAMLQVRKKPPERNVEGCAANKLQAFHFVKKDKTSNSNVSVSRHSVLPCVLRQKMVIPDSASEGNSDDDEEEDRIEAIRRPRHAHQNANVFLSPDTPVMKTSNQQKAKIGTPRQQESDDEFELPPGVPQAKTRNYDGKKVHATFAGCSKQRQPDVKDERLRSNCRRTGSARQWQLRDGSKRRKRKAAIGREFLDEEAELSSDHAVSSDENVGSEEDILLADSFIDDNTQSTERSPQDRHHNGMSPFDMQAVYRRSLLSPSCQRGQYKLVFGHQRNRRRLHYSSSELDSSFINDNEGSDMDGSQAEEDNRLVMSEAEESEEIDSTVVDRRMEDDFMGSESPAFVSVGVKERRRQRAVLEISSEHNSTTSIEPPKKSPRLPTLTVSSPVLFVSPIASVRSPGMLTSTKNLSKSVHMVNRQPPAAQPPSDCHQSLMPSNIPTETFLTEASQFDMFDDDLDQQLQELDERVFSQETPEAAGAATVYAVVSPSSTRTETIPLIETSTPVSREKSLCSLSPRCLNKPTTQSNDKKPAGTQHVKKMRILVNAREVSTASQTVSTLRLSQQIDLAVCTLSHCDYIVSNRMGVKRIQQSNLSHSSKSCKVVDSLRLMFDLFERPCLIIERDREKSKDINRLHNRTRHFDNNLAALAQTHTKVLFSDSQGMTAALLMDLAVSEGEKGASIDASCDLPREITDPVLRVLLSIPCLSFIAALNLFQSFSSLHEIVSSSPDELVCRTRSLSNQRAKAVVSYLRHKFDADMMPR